MMAVRRDAVQGNGRAPVLLVAVLAVLFGILGMHALNSHGAMAGQTSGGAQHQMSSSSAPEQGHTTAATVVVNLGQAIDPASSDALSAPAGSGHGPTGMLMLCLAMLVAVALTVAAVWRSGKPLWRRLRPPHVVGRLRAAARGAGPPPSWEFSVIRC